MTISRNTLSTISAGALINITSSGVVSVNTDTSPTLGDTNATLSSDAIYKALTLNNNELTFINVNSVNITSIPSGITVINTLGYYTAGDYGAATYIRASGSGYGNIQSADGQWWTLSVNNVNLLQFGAKGDNTYDNGPALNAAFAFCQLNYPATLNIPNGVFKVNTPLNPITRPFSILGKGKRVSMLQMSSSLTGDFFVLQNVGFGNESVDLPQTGNTAWTSLSGVGAGMTVRDIAFQGDRSASAPQNGVVWQGNCDNIGFEDCEILYFNGHGFEVGRNYGSGAASVRGNARECMVDKIWIRHCGNASGGSDFYLHTDDSPGNPSADSANLNKFLNINCIFSYGPQFKISDNRTTNNGSPIYGNEYRIITHNRFSSITASVGRAISITGGVTESDFYFNVAYNPNNDYTMELLPNSVAGTNPYDNNFGLWMPNVVKGVYVGGVGNNNNIRFFSYYGSGEALAFASGYTPQMRVDCESDTLFQPITSSITLSGTSAVSLPIGTYGTTQNLSSFFPPYNTGGTGDTMRATLFGINGVITRSGVINPAGGGTDTYTFTPDASSTAFIPSGEYCSKCVVNTTLGNYVTGRYKYVPENRYGIAANGTWNSNRVLTIWPWQYWVENATGFTRQNYGKPSADNVSTSVLQPIRSGFVGTSATPSIAGLSKLVANYAVATTITNFTTTAAAQQDGQSIILVATNNNCTIANNSNIATATGAPLVLTTGQVARFTYDNTLAKWLQG